MIKPGGQNCPQPINLNSAQLLVKTLHNQYQAFNLLRIVLSTNAQCTVSCDIGTLFDVTKMRSSKMRW